METTTRPPNRSPPSATRPSSASSAAKIPMILRSCVRCLKTSPSEVWPRAKNRHCCPSRRPSCLHPRRREKSWHWRWSPNACAFQRTRLCWLATCRTCLSASPERRRARVGGAGFGKRSASTTLRGVGWSWRRLSPSTRTAKDGAKKICCACCTSIPRR